MKLFPGVSLIVAATIFLSFSFIAFAIAIPQTFNDRAVFLLALAVAGVVLGAIGLKDLRRASQAPA